MRYVIAMISKKMTATEILITICLTKKQPTRRNIETAVLRLRKLIGQNRARSSGRKLTMRVTVQTVPDVKAFVLSRKPKTAEQASRYADLNVQ